MDLNLATAFWFASRGRGHLHVPRSDPLLPPPLQLQTLHPTSFLAPSSVPPSSKLDPKPTSSPEAANVTCGGSVHRFVPKARLPLQLGAESRPRLSLPKSCMNDSTLSANPSTSSPLAIPTATCKLAEAELLRSKETAPTRLHGNVGDLSRNRGEGNGREKGGGVHHVACPVPGCRYLLKLNCSFQVCKRCCLRAQRLVGSCLGGAEGSGSAVTGAGAGGTTPETRPAATTSEEDVEETAPGCNNGVKEGNIHASEPDGNVGKKVDWKAVAEAKARQGLESYLLSFLGGLALSSSPSPPPLPTQPGASSLSNPQSDDDMRKRLLRLATEVLPRGKPGGVCAWGQACRRRWALPVPPVLWVERTGLGQGGNGGSKSGRAGTPVCEGCPSVELQDCLCVLCPGHRSRCLAENQLGKRAGLKARGACGQEAQVGNGGVGPDGGGLVQGEGRGSLGEAYISNVRVLLLGTGADEFMGGYSRHRNTYKKGGIAALVAELQKDQGRLWARNLGRDDRCISDHGREARFPYLDENVLGYLRSLPLEEVCNMEEPSGQGDKKILRQVASILGLKSCRSLPKRAIQFGSRIAQHSSDHSHGSRRRGRGGDNAQVTGWTAQEAGEGVATKG